MYRFSYKLLFFTESDFYLDTLAHVVDDALGLDGEGVVRDVVHDVGLDLLLDLLGKAKVPLGYLHAKTNKRFTLGQNYLAYLDKTLHDLPDGVGNVAHDFELGKVDLVDLCRVKVDVDNLFILYIFFFSVSIRL